MAIDQPPEKQSDPDEHLSEHGYFHELISDDKFICSVLKDPGTAVKEVGLQWDARNDERLEIARQRVLDFARTAFQEVRVLNFRNCAETG